MRNAEKKRGSRIEDRDCSDIFLAYAYYRLSPASRLVPRASFLDPRPFHFAILVSPPFLRRHPRQLQAAYPPSEAYKCSLNFNSAESSGDIDVYTLFFRKGYVEKAKFYFLKNQLAMVIEQSYPGAEISVQIYKRMTARYGQFAGRGSASWKRRADYLVMINHHAENEVTAVSYLYTPLADSLRERTNYIRSDEERAIDPQIREVRSEIDSLSIRPDSLPPGKKQ